MIRLKRPKAPAILIARSASETGILKRDYTNKKKLEIKPGIYAHHSVKKALRKAQHSKCAYCETKNPRSHDVVEHYRPKMGWRQQVGTPLQMPQYFWLAYDWDNLLFACDLCNDAGHKQNLFPLSNPSSRATISNYDVSAEKPLIINPYKENPSKFIEWSADLPVTKGSNRKGSITIQIFKLAADQDLIDARRGHFNVIGAALENAEGLPTNDIRRKNTKKILEDAMKPSGQYSAMIRTSFEARISNL